LDASDGQTDYSDYADGCSAVAGLSLVAGWSPNSTWLVMSRHDTFDVSSPCILAMSSLSNSTLRHTQFAA